jgi:hypothetical protein
MLTAVSGRTAEESLVTSESVTVIFSSARRDVSPVTVMVFPEKLTQLT